MKQLVFSELHDIEMLDGEKVRELCRFLKNTTVSLKTYNQVMKFMCSEESRNRLGALIICPGDIRYGFVFQHLPLFCRHFGIKLLGLVKGSRAAVEHASGRSPAAMFGILKEDPVFEEINRLVLP